MGWQVGENKGVVASMNVVPLIDILLVLIILFMVITPTTPHGLQALLPQRDEVVVPVDPLPDAVVVQVLPGDKLGINQETTTWDELGSRLETIFKQRAEKVAFVQGDADVQFAQVARAIGILRGSDVEKIGLITTKLEASR